MIEVVRPAVPHRLGVGVGELGLGHQHLAGDGTDGPEFTVLARGDRARDPEPFADIAILADALPHFGRWTVDGDFQGNGDVGRRGDRAADRGGRRSLSPAAGACALAAAARQASASAQPATASTNCLRMESSNQQILIPNTGRGVESAKHGRGTLWCGQAADADDSEETAVDGDRVDPGVSGLTGAGPVGRGRHRKRLGGGGRGRGGHERVRRRIAGLPVQPRHRARRRDDLDADDEAVLPGTTPSPYASIVYSAASGDSLFFTTNVRVEIPTTSRRVIPFAIGPGGVASTTQRYTVTISPAPPPVPVGLVAVPDHLAPALADQSRPATT